MFKWTFVTNISYVDYNGVRLWAHAVSIDPIPTEEEKKNSIGRCRQIRGVTWGGLPVFTIWIPDDAQVELQDNQGGSLVLLSHTGETINMDQGLNIVVNVAPDKVEKIHLGIDDPNQHMVVEQIEVESHPFGDEVDRRLHPFNQSGSGGGLGYPSITWKQSPALNPIAPKNPIDPLVQAWKNNPNRIAMEQARSAFRALAAYSENNPGPPSLRGVEFGKREQLDIYQACLEDLLIDLGLCG